MNAPFETMLRLKKQETESEQGLQRNEQYSQGKNMTYTSCHPYNSTTDRIQQWARPAESQFLGRPSASVVRPLGLNGRQSFACPSAR